MRPAGLFAFALAASAGAQVTPVWLYNGVDRPFSLSVALPARAKKVALRWEEPDGTARATVALPATTKGRRDLAKLLPSFWNERPTGVTYLQLVVDGKPFGPGVVLQPMTNPPVVRLGADGRTPEFTKDEDEAFAGYRAYVDQDLVVDTEFGEMRFRLRPDCAPNTAFEIRRLAEGGIYRGTIFHRVVAKTGQPPFVVQGGDPTGTGSGAPGFSYALEKSPLEHRFGVISIARSTDPNTNGCQFFVALSRKATARLDGRYAAFGELVEGEGTLRRLAAVPVGESDRPTNPPKIRDVRLVPAAPRGSGQRVQTSD